MSRAGKNPSYEEITLQGYANFTLADASTKVQGRLVYVRDTNQLYKDTGLALEQVGGAALVTSVNGEIGDVILDKDDIGLDQVDNTSDADKPISDATQAALDNKMSVDGLAINVNTGVSYTTPQAAVDAASSYEAIFIPPLNGPALNINFTGKSNLVIFGHSSSGSENTRIGSITIDSTCTSIEFKELDFFGTSAPAYTDTGSIDTTFYECRFDKAASSNVVVISGNSAGLPLFKSCRFISGQVLNSGTNFAGFIEFNYCERIVTYEQTGNAGCFMIRSQVTASVEHAGGLLNITDSTVSFIESTANGFPLPPGIAFLTLNGVKILNGGTFRPEIIDKTGTCTYIISDTIFKIDGSTLNGTDISESYISNFAINFLGKDFATLDALPRIAGSVYYASDLNKLVYDDGTSLVLLNEVSSNVVETDADITASVGDTVLVQGHSGLVTVTLPSAVGEAGKSIAVKVLTLDILANPVTVAADGSELIDSLGTYSLGADDESIKLVSTGSGWLKV